MKDNQNASLVIDLNSNTLITGENAYPVIENGNTLKDVKIKNGTISDSDTMQVGARGDVKLVLENCTMDGGEAGVATQLDSGNTQLKMVNCIVKNSSYYSVIAQGGANALHTVDISGGSFGDSIHAYDCNLKISGAPVIQGTIFFSDVYNAGKLDLSGLSGSNSYTLTTNADDSRITWPDSAKWKVEQVKVDGYNRTYSISPK